jgi:hypothetical protein
MELSGYLNPKRLLSLFKIEFFNNRKIYLLSNGIVAVLFLFFNTFFTHNSRYSGEFYSMINVSLLIGIILTSSTFAGLHENDRAVQYFLLPASVEEKLIVKLLFTSVVYFCTTSVFFVMALFVSGIIRSGISGIPDILFNPFNFSIIKVLSGYIFFHSIYFLGSLLFKKNSLIKTTLSFIAFSIGVLVLLRISIFGLSASFQIISFGIMNFFNEFNKLSYDSGNGFKFILKISVYLIPVALYLMSYFKLKSIEVK